VWATFAGQKPPLGIAFVCGQAGLREGSRSRRTLRAFPRPHRNRAWPTVPRSSWSGSWTSSRTAWGLPANATGLVSIDYRFEGSGSRPSWPGRCRRAWCHDGRRR